MLYFWFSYDHYWLGDMISLILWWYSWGPVNKTQYQMFANVVIKQQILRLMKKLPNSCFLCHFHLCKNIFWIFPKLCWSIMWDLPLFHFVGSRVVNVRSINSQTTLRHLRHGCLISPVVGLIGNQMWSKVNRKLVLQSHRFVTFGVNMA